MNYLLGIDGGGTKTAYLLIDELGRRRASAVAAGCDYKEIGMEQVAVRLRQGIERCLADAGASSSDLAGIALGLPCFGEGGGADDQIKEYLEQSIATVPLHIVNDVEVGFAGSLGLGAGIHVVAGTGSIAFGMDSHRQTARCGGWSTFYGDEGSCYWLGRRTIELFFKQADGRSKRGPLYDIVMEELKLSEPVDCVASTEHENTASRDQVASYQRLLLLAAKAGDAAAGKLYREAAKELAMMVRGIYSRLSFAGGEVPVSYSGGLFHAEDFVLPRLTQLVEETGGRLTRPEFEPVEGAVLLAADIFGRTDLTVIKQQMKKEGR